MNKFLFTVIFALFMLFVFSYVVFAGDVPSHDDPIIGTWEVGSPLNAFPEKRAGYITRSGKMHLHTYWNKERVGHLDREGKVYDAFGNPAGTVLDYRPKIAFWWPIPEPWESEERIRGEVVIRITDAVAQKFAGEHLPQLVRLVEAGLNYIRAIGATPMEDAKVMDSYNALLEVSGGRMSSSVAGVEMFVVGTPPGKLYIFLTQYETNLQGAEIMFVNDGVQPPSGGDGDSPTGDPPGGDPPLG